MDADYKRLFEKNAYCTHSKTNNGGFNKIPSKHKNPLHEKNKTHSLRPKNYDSTVNINSKIKFNNEPKKNNKFYSSMYENQDHSNAMPYEEVEILDYSMSENDKKKKHLMDPDVPTSLYLPKTKALQIALMEDGITKSPRPDIFYVYSNSNNHRMVDMWACTCSCPAGLKPIICSHLYAVAMQNPQFSFRFSLHFFLRHKLNILKVSSLEILDLNEITSWMKKIFINKALQQYSLKEVFSWILEAFCGLMARLIQSEVSFSTTGSHSDNRFYNHPSDDQVDLLHQRKKLRSGLENAQKKLKGQKNPQLSVIERFILFFESFGKKGKTAVSILKLIVEKNRKASKAQIRQYKKLRSQAIIDVDSSSSGEQSILYWNIERNHELKECSEINWNFDPNPILSLCHWLEYGAHHPEIKKSQLLNVETQTEESTHLISSVSECKPIDFLLYIDEVISEITKRKSTHSSYLSLLADVSFTLKERYEYSEIPLGICEILGPRLEMLPELKKVSTLNECYINDVLNKSFVDELEKVMRGLLPVANDVLNNFNKATDVVKEFLQFPAFLDLSPNRLKDISNEKKSFSSDLQFVDYKKLCMLHAQFGLFKYEKNDVNGFSSVNQNIKNALESISSAPFGVSLADIIKWGDTYQNCLGTFKDFILFKVAEFEKCSLGDIIQIEYNNFIKIPFFNSKQDYLKQMLIDVKNNNVWSLWGHCLACLYHFPAVKDEIQTFSTTLPSGLQVALFVKNEFFRFVPNSLRYILKWFLFCFGSNTSNQLTDNAEILIQNEITLVEADSKMLNEQDTLLEQIRKSNNDEINVDVSNCIHQWSSSENEEQCDQSTVSYDNWKDLVDDILIHELGVSENQNLTTVEKNCRNRLSRAISKLSTEIYSDSFHFVLELIQNADDNIYCETMNKSFNGRRSVPGLYMISTEWGIACVNNEKGFRPQDVRALCDIGCSSKTSKEHDTSKQLIGKFGIGFKSVFMYTECPYIFSNNLSLAFDNNNKTGLGALAPQLLKETWRSICPEVVVRIIDSCGIQDSTVFWLPKSPKQPSSCTLLENVSPLWILFLNQLETLIFYDLHLHSYIRVMREICNHEATNACNSCPSANLPPQYQHIKIKIMESRLVNETFSKVDCVEKELDFLLVKNNEKSLYVAYLINKKTGLFEPLSSNLCVYLPVKNVGLKFPVHGEFRLTTTRENILNDDCQNLILLKKLGTFIAESISYLAELTNQSILQLLPFEKELDSSVRCVSESVYHTLVATLKIPQLSLKNKISIMKNNNFVLPPHNLLSPKENNKTLISTNNRLLNQLFTSLALLDLEESCDESRTFRPIVDMTFIQEATLDVCSFLLRIPFFNAWDIVDRLSVLEKILKEKKFMIEEEYNFWSKVVGGFFIILNICLESTDNNFAFLHLFHTLKRLCIYPIKCSKKENISTSDVFVTLIKKPDNLACEKTLIYIPSNEKTLDDRTRRLQIIAEDVCHVLNPSFFLWNEVCDNSCPLVLDDHTQNVYQALNHELQVVLGNLNVYSINDPHLLVEYFFPLLHTPLPITEEDLVRSLAFVLLKEIDGVESIIYHTSVLNEGRKEELKKKLGDSYVLINESAECKRRLGTQNFLSRTGEVECKEVSDMLLSVPCILTQVHNSNQAQNIFNYISKQRAPISHKYWAKYIKDNHLFWDQFFLYWGAQSFWYLQSINYNVEIFSEDNIHITLHECPLLLCSFSKEIVTNFLNKSFSIKRFKDQTQNIVFPISINVEDSICIEFLKILELLQLCNISDIKINDSCTPNLFKLLSFLFEKMYHLHCAAQPAKTNNGKEVLNSFILQLQCLPWIPGFIFQKESIPIVSITELTHDFLNNVNMQLLPPITMLKYSSNNFETAMILNLLTSTQLTLMANFLDVTVAPSFYSTQTKKIFFSKLCISEDFSIDSLMLLLGTLVDKIIQNNFIMEYGSHFSDASLLKISLLQQYLNTLRKIHSYCRRSCTSTDDIDATLQQKLITLFNEKKLVLVYDSTKKCWFGVLLKNLFWSFPPDFELQNLMCSFSFIDNTLLQIHSNMPSIKNMSQSQQLDGFAQDKKDFQFFFNKILKVSETPNIQQLIWDIEYIQTLPDTYTSFSSTNTDVQRNISHIVQCLRAIYLIKNEHNVLNIHDGSNQINDYLKRKSSAYSEQRILSLTSKKYKLNWLTDVTQKVIPVLTLADSIEFISFTEAQSDPYVTIIVTYSDETVRNELATIEKKFQAVPPYKYILGCFKLAYGESKNSLQQKWWNNICTNLVQYPSLSYSIGQQYAGQESIKLFNPKINLQIKANFSYLILFLAFPLITRYFLCTNPELLTDFCQENSAEAMYKKINGIGFGWINTLVCCRWLSTIDERLIKDTSAPISICSADDFEMCLIVTLGLVSSDTYYPEILEKILVYLFPFCKRNSVVFYVVTMITSFATATDLILYNDPIHNFKFPNHLEIVLTTLADVPLLSDREISPFLNNVSNWFSQLQSMWIYDYKYVFEGLTNLNILDSIISHVNFTNANTDDEQEAAEKKNVFEDISGNEFQIVSSNIFAEKHENRGEEHLSTPPIECLDNTNYSNDCLDLCSISREYNAELIVHKKNTDDLLPNLSSGGEFLARIGRVGEELAYRYLLTTYDKQIESKSISVTWVNKHRESGLPYDILLKYHTAHSINNKEVYVEVKATASVSKAIFEITNAEWRFAQLKGDNYHIYRIFGVHREQYSILRVQNPYKEWRNKNMRFYLSF